MYLLAGKDKIGCQCPHLFPIDTQRSYSPVYHFISRSFIIGQQAEISSANQTFYPALFDDMYHIDLSDSDINLAFAHFHSFHILPHFAHEFPVGTKLPETVTSAPGVLCPFHKQQNEPFIVPQPIGQLQ